ncbi:MAG TPA: hypothetical protein VE262_03140 [Blastocatellia bacterium]|nr:hypothetical protein [Blastocatellia bacterium]
MRTTGLRSFESGSIRATVTLVAIPVILAAAGLGSAWLYLWGGFLHRFIQGISGYIAMFIAHFAIYLLACYVVFRLPRPPSRALRVSTIVLVILFAALFRAELVGRPPYLSSDTYRYIWDGRVQSAGINPYRYVPSAPELQHLREEKIYPRINRSDYAPTPYPPVAQALYFAIYTVYPLSITAFKVAMSLFDMIAMLAIMSVLARAGLDPARAILFAWHPLLIWEGAHSGHVESAFIAFIALGLLARTHGKAALTGCAIGLAAMVKFYPALLLPVFMFSGAASLGDPRQLSARRAGRALEAVRSVLLNGMNVRLILAFACTVALAYLPYLSAGKGVLGYLPNEFKEEGYLDSGSRYFILLLINSALPVPTIIFMTFAAVSLAGLGLWFMVKKKADAVDVARGSIAMIGLFWLFTTPRYTWYYAWILPFLCFVPRVAWLYLTGATILLYLLWFIPNVYPHLPVWLGAALYAPTLLFLLWELKRPREPQRVIGSVPNE